VPQVKGEVPAALVGETARSSAVHRGGTSSAKHALKGQYQLATRNSWLDAKSNDTATPLVADLSVSARPAGKAEKIEGKVAELPGFSHATERANGQVVTTDSFSGSAGTYSLRLALPEVCAVASGPIVGVSDANPAISLALSKPLWVMAQDWSSPDTDLAEKQVRSFSAQLGPKPLADERLQERWTFVWPKAGLAGADVRIAPRYYYNVARAFEKTASLAKWDKTTIEGLTSEPLILRGEASQTMSPGHHNFYEEFLFEPRSKKGSRRRRCRSWRGRTSRRST